MTVTATQMANRALIRLGSAQRITSINAGGMVESQFADEWDGARDHVMQSHPWNFAVTRREIPADGDFAPVGGQYAYRYTLPNDCLRWLPPDPGDADWFAGEQEAGKILSNNEGPLVVRYIARVTDVTAWSAAFVEAMTWYLAYVIAPSISASVSMQDRMLNAYYDALAAAKTSDGLASGRTTRNPPMIRSRLVASRHRRTTGGY